MASTQKIDFKNFTWINITKPTEKVLLDLQQKYGFHPLDVADCLKPSQRSKIDVYPSYTFLVFLFPKYKRQSRAIYAEELNFFIGGKYLISVGQGDLEIFNQFFERFKISTELRDQYQDKSPERLLYEIINRLYIYCFPMVDHLSKDCDNIEEAIFSGHERRMVSEILIIRRNITDLRKTMQVHKNVLKKAILEFKNNPLYAMKKTDVYFESLVDYSKEIWDALENLKERIEALQQTNESQISFRLSDIMRILTTISVITFPVTLLATIFGMNTIHAMPFINHPYGFWYVIIIMFFIIGLMITIFKKNKWM
ncbi:MAG: magnesium transporter CorA family protein [Candidatus Magasanikbacteria bacterium]|nr:magnesium transporter CorA family protein [Candidatus Magasanikbacteria bacterium]